MDNSFNSLIKDLLTPKEIKVLKKRFTIIKLLKSDLTYREIAKKIGISTTTVVRLNKRLKIRVNKNNRKEKRLKKLPWVIG